MLAIIFNNSICWHCYCHLYFHYYDCDCFNSRYISSHPLVIGVGWGEGASALSLIDCHTQDGRAM